MTDNFTHLLGNEEIMQLTANEDILVAIRTLVEYMKDDEREDYQEKPEQGEGDGHIYESIMKIEEWLAGPSQVLYMEAGSDVCSGLPKALCNILTEQEAIKRFEEVLRVETPLPYNPRIDRVQVSYETSDAMGQEFYGFVPLDGVNGDMTNWLSFECEGEPLDTWRVIINGEVAYEEPDEE